MRRFKNAAWHLIHSTDGAAQFGEAVLLGIVLISALSAIHLVIKPPEKKPAASTTIQQGWPDLPEYERSRYRPNPLRR